MAGWGDALAALSSALGGLGEGSYKGYVSGAQEALEKQKLAQQQQQFEESNYIPAKQLPQSLQTFLPAGLEKINKSALPTYETEMTKQRDEQLRRERGSAMGEALRNNTFTPAAGQPLSPGTGMMSSLRDEQIANIAPILEQEPEKGLATLNTLLHGKFGATSLPTSRLVQDTNGNWIEVPVHKGMTGATPTGIQGPVSRNADLVTLEKSLRLNGVDTSTPQGAAELARQYQAAKGPVLYTPGQQMFERGNLPNQPQLGLPPQPGAPRGTYQTQGPQFEQFVTDARARTPGITDDQIMLMWQHLLSQTPTTAEFKTQPGQTPGQPQAGRGQPLVAEPPRTPVAEVEKVAAYKTYLEEVTQLADMVEKWQRDRSKGQNAKMAARNFIAKNDPTNMFNAVVPLSPEETEIKALGGRLLQDYEQNKGGMRAVSGPQIQGAMAQVHGGDPLSNPTGFINLRSIAQSELKRLQHLGATAGQAGQRDIYAPPPAAEKPVVKWGKDENGNPVRLK